MNCIARCIDPGTPPGNPGTPPGNPGSPPCLIGCGPKLPPPIVGLHHPHPWYFAWHRPHWGIIGEDGPVFPVTAVGGDVATAAAAAPCNCLTKQYLDDGSVLFTDICTKEEALATPDELRAQAQGVAPQAQAR